ncbi:MAG: 16S rRNA (guanine(966)-N(2))-methyltransferase RsmD [Candidatus Omnitrophica bacterium]|nr:16S rRNA (guanine(966)-N(2))-methyltransferase RsmD [Candidatus Omnitrophota bacterium]
MRIIAGKYKGKKIDFPKVQNVRPTQDKVKEAIFNILKDEDLTGAKVLDLFAGSGSLGLEAVSRGAAKAVFIDSDPKSFATIRKNIKSLACEDITEVFRTDFDTAIKKLHRNGYVFDIIFLDPPYYKDLPKKALLKMCQYDILSPYNIIIIEHSKRDLIPESLDKINLLLTKKYGDTFVSFYRKIQ